MPPRKKATTATSRKKAPASRKTSTRKSTVKALAAAEAAGPRRSIFIDVENTSGEEAILTALNELGFECVTSDTHLVAVGNWRVIGAHVARMLAQRGARLVHTAPATGVKDWSDLSIAVASGIWLGRARPGDRIEIVSADRAFDAVGDAAAALGVIYRRVAYASTAAAATDELAGGRRRTRRGGRRRRRPEDAPAAPPRAAARHAAPPQPPQPPRQPPRTIPVEDVRAEEQNGAGPSEKDLHAAPPEAIVSAIARLTEKNPERGINLDLLIGALKDEGYGRPPGSPRLVTRLRMLKDVEVSPTGMVRLVPGAVVYPPPPEPAAESHPASEDGDATVGKGRRPRRRGGRRRRSGSPAKGDAASGEPVS